MTTHGERKHSKLSASGAERWFACPGSVAISEGLPDKDSVWSLEGTRAHEVLEAILENWIRTGAGPILSKESPEMIRHAIQAAGFILRLRARTPGADVLVESRVHLKFIHPDMFGTFDGAVVDHFGTLHVFDYKYGAGVSVSPKENLQMIFYGIGLASRYDWNFKRVRLWIIQPRIKGYDGPVYWELSVPELWKYVGKFTRAVKRVEQEPTSFVEGGHCHWCKAKGVCPLKQEQRAKNMIDVFTRTPIKFSETVTT